MPDALPRVRSWLFVPGHNERMIRHAFNVATDAVLLDLEDAVPHRLKASARALVADVLTTRQCWVRVNRPNSSDCEEDLVAVGRSAAGLRVPKVDCPSDVEWVAQRAPGLPLDCSIESARGVLNAFAIASTPACKLLSYGGIDLTTDLRIVDGDVETLYARSAVVVAARAAGKPSPSDGVFDRTDDDAGLRLQCESARRLGFFGKSAIHPRQVPIINEAFTTTDAEVEWAKSVLAAFEAAGHVPTRSPDGDFIDLAVARRARLVLGQNDGPRD